MASSHSHITRLAPSPTGALHLGNARTFLVNWALARQRGWRIVLRIEDLDGPRIKPGAIEQTIDILAWLGLDWDEGPIIQSEDLSPYREAMQVLAARGLVYPCSLTRSEIAQAASAPNEGERETRFPPALRPGDRPRYFDDGGEIGGASGGASGGAESDPERERNWRFVVEAGSVRFTDGFLGEQALDPSESVGDFVVWTNRGQPSYQLAVVVDDARQGVTEVVRGDDLLDSAGRQIRLIEALGLGRPRYTHLPLVRGEDGRRLAKRHGDTRLSYYREQGVAAERVIGLLAGWSGLAREPMSAEAFGSGFGLDTMPRDDVTFTAEDDRWLLASG